ncbi:glycoside hydrolase, family 32 [Tanacetum coccineum]
MIEEEAFNLCSSLSVEKSHVQTAGCAEVNILVYQVSSTKKDKFLLLLLNLTFYRLWVLANIGLYKEAFKTDLEGSPPEATYERCNVLLRFNGCVYRYGYDNSQYVDLAKSLPRPLLSAAIVNPTKDEDMVMVQLLLRIVVIRHDGNIKFVCLGYGERYRYGVFKQSISKEGREGTNRHGVFKQSISKAGREETTEDWLECLCYDGIESDLNEFIIYDDIGSWANVDDFQWSGAVWGNIAWAHSVLKDMVNWIHLEHATVPSKPYDKYGCWSGSAMILPGDKPVIMYTGIVDPKPKLGYQNVLAFRDPTTAWYNNGHWKLLLGSRHKHRGVAYLYRSRDFVTWIKAKHPFHSKNDTGMWECTDFFPVAREGIKGLNTSTLGNDVKYVLKNSLEVSRIVWGWANESSTAKEDVAKGWSGIQLIPHTVWLDPNGNGLLQWPISELEKFKAYLRALSDSIMLIAAKDQDSGKNIVGDEARAKPANCAHGMRLD